ncbi:MAG: HAD-IA family hydrolase [Fimbriimonadaceae bacterium]
MKIKLLSLDVYNTLLRPTGSLGELACELAQEYGHDVSPNAAPLFQEVVYLVTREHSNLPDPDIGAMWVHSCQLWLRAAGVAPLEPEEFAQQMQAEMREEPRRLFEPFSDVDPAFEILKTKDVAVCALSNWDFTLEAVLAAYSWRAQLDYVVPCLVYGVHKPNPESYRLLTELTGIEPNSILHVGDSMVDDCIAPKSVGLSSRHIDRGSFATGASARSLVDVVETL